MKKNKVKSKTPKEPGAIASKGQVVKLKPAKPRQPWTSKLPNIKQYWSITRQFVVDAWQELKKVNWPGRKETLGGTGVVLILVFIISIFLGFIDLGLSRLVKTVVH